MFFKNIRKFYTLPKSVQWVLAVVFSLVGIVIPFAVINIVYFPFWFITIPVIKTICHFSVVPLMRLSGLIIYYSPMLLAIRTDDNILELHNGTVFDYILNMKWRHKGSYASKYIMINYLNGLLKIIKEVEEKKIPGNITILGISYIINKKTAEKLGFTVEKPSTYRRMLFLIDYFTLFLMYSYSKGKIAFPNVFDPKKIKISSGKLVESKEKILQIASAITSRQKKAEMPA